jgi:hypothetical protein
VRGRVSCRWDEKSVWFVVVAGRIRSEIKSAGACTPAWRVSKAWSQSVFRGGVAVSGNARQGEKHVWEDSLTGLAFAFPRRGHALWGHHHLHALGRSQVVDHQSRRRRRVHREPLTLQAGQALLLLRRGRLLESRTMRRGVVVFEVADPCRRCSITRFRSPSSSSSEGASKHFLLGGGGIGIQDWRLSDERLSPCWGRCLCGGRRRRSSRRRRGKGVLQGREVERLIRATVLEELLRGCSVAGIGGCGSERVLLWASQVSRQGLCSERPTPGDEPVPMDRLANRQSDPAGGGDRCLSAGLSRCTLTCHAPAELRGLRCTSLRVAGAGWKGRTKRHRRERRAWRRERRSG